MMRMDERDIESEGTEERDPVNNRREESTPTDLCEGLFTV
jgi:hypothetical protein